MIIDHATITVIERWIIIVREIKLTFWISNSLVHSNLFSTQCEVFNTLIILRCIFILIKFMLFLRILSYVLSLFPEWTISICRTLVKKKITGKSSFLKKSDKKRFNFVKQKKKHFCSKTTARKSVFSVKGSNKILLPELCFSKREIW